MGCGASVPPPPKEPPIPEDLEPGLVPFYTIAGGRGELQREEIEGMLKAIGMRKSVLALAVDPMDQMGKDAKDSMSVPEWWSALNPRSRIVINSKLSGFDEQQTLFALACAVYGTARIRKVSASKADLSKALCEVGMEPGPELDAMLAHCKEEGPTALDKWYESLSPEAAAKLREMLNADA